MLKMKNANKLIGSILAPVNSRMKSPPAVLAAPQQPPPTKMTNQPPPARVQNEQQEVPRVIPLVLWKQRIEVEVEVLMKL